MSWRRVLAPLTAAVALSLGVAGCDDGATSINEQMRQGDEKGYVEGTGTIQQLAPEQRTEPMSLAGQTLQDEPWNAQDHRGEVVVVNVWASWCPPCDAEMPDLVQVATEFTEAGEPVTFVGINDRDSVETARAFEARHEVPYPSLQADGGRARAQLGSAAVATPTTLLLDQQGRVAARASGQVDAGTLRGLIEDVLDSR